MQQELKISQNTIHASFRQLSDRHAGSQGQTFKGLHDSADSKRNQEARKKEVQQLILGLGACMLASLAAGFAILLINAPQ